MNYIYFLVSFVVVYLFYLFTVILQKKRYDKFKKSNQVLYFVKIYKLDVDKIDMFKFTNILGLANAFIMGLTFTIICMFENIIIQLLIALVILLPLMFLFYHLIGKYFKRGVN